MKKLFLILVMCGFLSGVSSCESFEDIVPHEYDTILSLQNAGLQDVTLYRTGSPTDYKVTIMKSGYNTELPANVKFSLMNTVEFEQYLNQAGVDYKMLPEDCYTLPEQNIAFSNSDKWKILNISIDPEKVEPYIGGSDTYVIPIILSSETDSILSTKNNLIIRPDEIVSPKVSVGDAVNGAISKELGKEGGILEIPIELQIDNLWDFKVTVEADPASTFKGVTLENNGVVEFVKGNQGILKIKVDPLTQISGNVIIRLKSIEGIGFDLQEEATTINIIVQKYPLTIDMLSTNAQEPSEGPLKNVLDGDVNTFFHTAWSIGVAENHYVLVTLPKSINKFEFSYTNRSSNGNAALANFNVYIGDSESSLKLYKNYTIANDNLPMNGAGVYKSAEIASDTPIK